jgi:hypothetical protein
LEEFALLSVLAGQPPSSGEGDAFFRRTTWVDQLLARDYDEQGLTLEAVAELLEEVAASGDVEGEGDFFTYIPFELFRSIVRRQHDQVLATGYHRRPHQPIL